MENNLNDIIATSLEKIKEFADTETVTGEPINTPNGTTIIPVSKVSMGFATGALGNSSKEKTQKPRVGGGGGTGITVTPIAFLVISPSGKVDMLPVYTQTNDGTIDKITAIIERSPDILDRLKKVFTSDKKKEEKKEEAEPEFEVEIVEEDK